MSARITVGFPEARLEVEDIERLLQSLDRIWVALAQLVEHLAPDGKPRPRALVGRPAVVRTGFHHPHVVAYSTGAAPDRPQLWHLYRIVLAGPTEAVRWLPGWVDQHRDHWSVAERAARQAMLFAAVRPRSAARVKAGATDTQQLADPAATLLRRLTLDTLRMSTIGGPTLVTVPPAGSGL